MAALLTISLEWSTIAVRFAPAGPDYLAYLWRATLLGLIPLLGALLLMYAWWRFVAPRVAGLRDRLRALGSVPILVDAFQAVLVACLGMLLWVYLNFLWVDLDLNLWLPAVSWKTSPFAVVSSLPEAFLLWGATGFVLAQADRRLRRGARPLMFTHYRVLAGFLGALSAVGLATRPAGFALRYDPFLRTLAFAAFLIALTPASRNWTVRPGRLAVAITTMLILGGLAGAATLATSLAGIPNDALAIMDKNRPMALQAVAVPGSEIVDRPYVCPPSSDRPASSGVMAGRDLILVTVDALSATEARLDQPSRSPMPRLAELARSGVHFANSVSPGARTVVGLSGIHLSQLMGCVSLDPSADQGSLLRALSASGYRTAVTGGFTLDRGGVLPHLASAIAGEADTVEFTPDSMSFLSLTQDPGVRQIAEGMIERADLEAPLALWVHFLDPHALYLPPEHTRGTQGRGRLARYREELASTDSELGALLETHGRLRPGNPPLVVIAGDHGQAFSLGARFHSTDISQEMIATPLVIANLPGQDAEAGPIDRWVSLIDVAPTVLDALGVQIPPSFQGRSLLPLVRGESWSDQPLRIDMWPPPRISEGVILGQYKLVRRLRPELASVYGRSTVMELYDLSRDPKEQANLADDLPDVVDEMRGHLPRETFRYRSGVRWCGRRICESNGGS